jgi:zinc protease
MRASALFVLLFPALLQPQSLEVKSFTLDNGLKVLVQEDHNIPNVAMYLFFRVGSRNERPGITGISHFFEHMMFNGAKKYGPKQFDIEMEKNGGRNNAFTTRDITVFTDFFPSAALPLMMEMESDRVQSLALDPKMVESEREVVSSERRQSVEDSPIGTLAEQLNAAAFTAHPYGWPIIGWASDIKAWTRNDLTQHFRMGYAPNNCVMVIVGDIKSSAVENLAKEHFASIPGQPPPPPIRTVEPEQEGERRVIVEKPAQLPVQMYSFPSPATLDPDTHALQLLGTILSTGHSSRLYQRLIDRDRIAVSATFALDPSLDPGQIVFTVQPRAGVSVAQAEKAFFEELESIRLRKVTNGELRKAKNQMLTGLYRDLKTISDRAYLLGQYEIYLGDYHRLFTAAKELEAVTAADVQRVAAKYLAANKRTIATLVPTSAPAAATTATGAN